jgi:hypothetical protein
MSVIADIYGDGRRPGLFGHPVSDWSFTFRIRYLSIIFRAISYRVIQWLIWFQLSEKWIQSIVHCIILYTISSYLLLSASVQALVLALAQKALMQKPSFALGVRQRFRPRDNGKIWNQCSALFNSLSNKFQRFIIHHGVHEVQWWTEDFVLANWPLNAFPKIVSLMPNAEAMSDIQLFIAEVISAASDTGYWSVKTAQSFRSRNHTRRTIIQ